VVVAVRDDADFQLRAFTVCTASFS
jgi:hypothetical protein